jgi:hypothetical protein
MKSKGEYLVSTDHKNHDRHPHIGETVLFNPRPGELGYVAGTPRVPAIVVDVLGNDNLKLAVVAGDSLVLRLSAPRKTDRDPLGSWEFCEHDVEHHHSNAHELQQLQHELRELQAQVAALKLEMTTSHGHGKGRK